MSGMSFVLEMVLVARALGDAGSWATPQFKIFNPSANDRYSVTSNVAAVGNCVLGDGSPVEGLEIEVRLQSLATGRELASMTAVTNTKGNWHATLRPKRSWTPGAAVVEVWYDGTLQDTEQFVFVRVR